MQKTSAKRSAVETSFSSPARKLNCFNKRPLSRVASQQKRLLLDEWLFTCSRGSGVFPGSEENRGAKIFRSATFVYRCRLLIPHLAVMHLQHIV